MGKRKITAIISKSEWQALVSGTRGKITLYRKSELHHHFYDYPKKCVEVEIREINSISLSNSKYEVGPGDAEEGKEKWLKNIMNVM